MSTFALKLLPYICQNIGELGKESWYFYVLGYFHFCFAWRIKACIKYTMMVCLTWHETTETVTGQWLQWYFCRRRWRNQCCAQARLIMNSWHFLRLGNVGQLLSFHTWVWSFLDPLQRFFHQRFGEAGGRYTNGFITFIHTDCGKKLWVLNILNRHFSAQVICKATSIGTRGEVSYTHQLSCPCLYGVCQDSLF